MASENVKYNKKVVRLFLHPKNVGEIKNADGVGKVGNLLCGDIMWVYIKVDKKNNKEYIKEIKFKTLGCGAAIATSSIVTTLAKSKNLNEAIKISNRDVIKALGGLPPIKYHCSLLAEEALSEAIYNYLRKNKKKIPKLLQEKHKKALKTEKEYDKRFER